MVKITIRKNNIITHQVKFPSLEEGQVWLAQEEANKSFGETDRYLTLEEAQDKDLSIDGKLTIQEEIDGEIFIKYVFPKEYDVQIEDVTAQENQERINQESLKLLNETDWYVIRKSETGVEIPQEILEQRAQARANIVR